MRRPTLRPRTFYLELASVPVGSDDLAARAYAEDDDNDVFFMTRAFRKLGLEPWLHVVPNGRSAKHYLAGLVRSLLACFEAGDVVRSFNIPGQSHRR